MSDTPGGLRVLIVSEHVLVGESVRTALLTRGHVSEVLRFNARRITGHHEVGLLLTHSHDGAAHWISSFLGRSELPWLVLAPEERGPSWGAFYASGAAHVLPPSAGLDEVCRLLVILADGQGLSLSNDKDELLRGWRQQLLERQELTRRLETLTTREREVLRGLFDGIAVRAIADVNDVTESTVRTQVKAILRKLHVPSQLAAVAAYARVRADSAS